MDAIEINIHAVARDEGTIVLFSATVVETGDEITIAADHRCAHYIAMALEAGEHVVTEVEPWQIVSRA